MCDVTHMCGGRVGEQTTGFPIWENKQAGDHKNMEKSTKIKPPWKNHSIFEENPSISMSSKILVKIPAVLRKLCHMCPIAHVPHPPRSPICICSINQETIYPCAPLPMCPIAHVPHCSCVKKMSSCQKDVKCQKVKHIDYGGGSQEKIDIMRFTSNMKVTKIVQKHFLCPFWGFLVTIICDVKIDINMCEPHYVNLFFLWTSSIVCVFDFLTLGIFLTTWHLFDTWAMGNMGNGAHGQWSTFIRHIQT